MIALKEDLWEAVFTLKMLEKRIAKSVDRVKGEEKKLYRKMLDAIIENERELAKDYARQILRMRKKRRILEKYLSKLRLMRVDLETAISAKAFQDALLASAKAILRLRKSLNETGLIIELEKIRNTFEEIGIAADEIEESIDFREEERVEEFLRKAETVAEELIKEELPELPNKILEEEDEEIEEERRE